MKNLTKSLTAFLAAAVMTVSASGISAFATPAPEPQAGWEKRNDGWAYYDSNKYEFVSGKNFAVEGILYSFDENGICIKEYSGLIKENGVKRRYNKGIPYTGWTKNKNDNSRKYYLDGYPVTGDFPIEGKVYSFDKNGIYTGENTVPVLVADCGEKISSDTDKFRITVTAHDEKGNSYAAGEPVRMERWEKGKWVDCIGADVEYSQNESMAVINGIEGECFPNYDVVSFEPQKYTGNRFKEGYYRLVFTYWKSSGDGKMELSDKEFYAVFRVVPPVEVSMSEEIYKIADSRNIDVWAYIDINSEKLDTPEIISSITWVVFIMEDGYWEDFIPETSYEEGCDSVDSNGTISLDLSGCFEAGCYEVAVSFNSLKHTYYRKMFRVE